MPFLSFDDVGTQTETLDSLVAKLRTDEGKASALSKAIKRNVVDFEKVKSYNAAGSAFLDAKDFERAALNFERAGQFRLAGFCARLGKDEDAFNTYNSLADLLKEPKHEWSHRFNQGNFIRVMMEGSSLIPLLFYNDLRRFIQDPKTRFPNLAKDYLKEPPNFSPEMRNVILHSGQFFNAFLLNMLTYNIIDIAFPRMAEKWKIGISQAVSNGVIISYETGILPAKDPDPTQIPSAILGSLLYLGTHYVTRRLADRFNKNERRFHEP